jgi:hypothetical protein
MNERSVGKDHVKHKAADKTVLEMFCGCFNKLFGHFSRAWLTVCWVKLKIFTRVSLNCFCSLFQNILKLPKPICGLYVPGLPVT